MEMRAVFAKTLEELMTQNEHIIVIDADLAKANGTMPLREKFPERALDVGISEQHMASMAAGLASYGFKPFITTFTPFASRRICDQIAVSLAYAGLSAVIVGTDPGISAELNGGTHMSMEDMGVLRSIPEIVLFEPVDTVQLAKALPVLAKSDKLIYMRMFRKTLPDVFSEDYTFNLYKADVLRPGTDLTIAASGIMVQEALKAVEALEKEGILAELISVHTWKPLDAQTLVASVQKTGHILTCENHNVVGGLRSAIAEVLMEQHPCPMASIGVLDAFGQVAALGPLKEFYQMTENHIVKKAKTLLEPAK